MSTKKKQKSKATPKPPVGLQRGDNHGKQLGGITGKGFLPGQSGNPSGKRKGAVSITAALKRLLASGETVEKIAEAIINGVIVKRDPQFAKLLLDRIDGSIREIVSAHLTGTVIQPAAAIGSVIITLPNNHRNDPDFDPLLAGSATPAALPPVATIAAPPEQPAPVAAVVESKPEPKLPPQQDPSSPDYLPKCFRSGWPGTSTM